jgi:microcystin-dependent protein
MAGNKTFTELTELETVDKSADWMAVVDVSDTSASVYGTTKKALVDQFIGEKGDAATVDVGTTTTGEPGTNANVVNVGTTSAAILDFTIPRGDKGEKGIQGPQGVAGEDGEDAYVYIAYASDDSGTGFTTTFNPTLDYIAIKSTTTPIPSPSASDFTGLWKNYKGATGATGAAGADGIDGTDGASAYVYIAYASDANGTDFTTTFNPALNYIAIKSTNTEIVSPQASDFTGLWFNYKGEKGIQGPQGEKGDAATVNVGTTTTGLPGTSASVVNSGSTSAAILDFTIPRGDKGEQGPQGPQGEPGEPGEDGLDITWRGTYSASTSYVVNDAVYYNGGSYICIQNTTGNLPTNETYWNLMAAQGAPGEGSGDVSGPASATDNAVARFDSTTGKLIQDSLVTVSDTGSINIPAGQQYLVGGSPVEGYSDEQAQDAVAGMIADTDTVDFTYTDATPELKADVKDASITNAKLANMATKTYKGRTSATTGSPEDVSVATLKSDLSLTKTDVGLGNVDNVQQLPSSYLDIDGTLTANSDTKVASQKATKTYADTKLAKATNVTAINDTGIADGEIAVFNLTNKDIRTSDRTITTSLGADDTTIPTSKAVADAISASGGYTDENAQDAVGTILADTTTIDLTYTDDTPAIKADVKSASLTTSHLASGVLDTDLSSVSASDNTLPSAKATKTYVDSTKFTWRGAWATTTAYAVNDTVEYGGSGYICIVAHTSGTFATDLSAGKWEMFVEGVSADSIASTIHGATAKTTPVDADEVGLIDSAASNVLKKLTWSNLKATLKTYFDSVTTTLTNKTIDGRSNTITNAIPAGIIEMFGGSSAPTGYLLCDGSAVSRTTYSALFTAIGTTYGAGDGSTTFNLPNLKGKVPVGYNSSDTSFDTLGETGGEKTHTLTIAEMPSHGHRLYYQYMNTGEGATRYGIAYSAIADSNTDGWLGTTGGSGAHNNLQPYIVLNYIIKT